MRTEPSTRMCETLFEVIGEAGDVGVKEQALIIAFAPTGEDVTSSVRHGIEQLVSSGRVIRRAAHLIAAERRGRVH